MQPSEFKPICADDFIGPARLIVNTLHGAIARAQTSGGCRPLKLLFHGPPGVGKSALANYAQARLGVVKHSVLKLSGTQVRLEDVQEWARTLCYRDMFSPYSVLRIEEMDRASHTARAGLLTILDDLPDHVAVIVTTNQSKDESEKRFFSRFQTFELQQPSDNAVKKLLSRWPLAPDVAKHISIFCCGDVRLALNMAQTALDEGALIP